MCNGFHIRIGTYNDHIDILLSDDIIFNIQINEKLLDKMRAIKESLISVRTEVNIVENAPYTESVLWRHIPEKITILNKYNLTKHLEYSLYIVPKNLEFCWISSRRSSIILKTSDVIKTIDDFLEDCKQEITS